jgi:hypothetical protein
VERFIQRHQPSVTGVLSGFDRIRFRGTLRLIANERGLGALLGYLGVLLKDFKDYAMSLSERLKEASLAVAEAAGRPVRYLASALTCKEELARRIASEDRIGSGLICVLTAVEPCWSFHVRRDPEQKKLVLESSWRKCLHLYHYHVHPVLGFMHARVQSWFPFNLHVCINGREWLARRMDRAGLAYRRRENCFTHLADPTEAQRLFDEQLTTDFAAMLHGIVPLVHPADRQMFPRRPVDRYWSADETEWASDVMFKDHATLAALYPRLVRHGMQNLASRDVLRFLGRKVPASPGGGGGGGGGVHGNFTGEVVSDLKCRPEGLRIKHRVNANSIKMYDKQGSVLRVETTINDTRQFKVFRTPAGKRGAKPSWQKMRKGVADLHRRARVSQAANGRYLDAMADVEDKTPLRRLVEPLCRAVNFKGRPVRALNPLSPADAALLAHVARGEFTLNGFRNRDLRALLFPTHSSDPAEQRRRGGKITRLLRLLRAHGLIHKISKTHRYQLTRGGRTTITALLAAREADIVKLAA